jgi:hypothetical protein
MFRLPPRCSKGSHASMDTATTLFRLVISRFPDDLSSISQGWVGQSALTDIDFFTISLNMRHTFCICFVSLE